jgi:hypothetical protein
MKKSTANTPPAIADLLTMSPGVGQTALLATDTADVHTEAGDRRSVDGSRLRGPGSGPALLGEWPRAGERSPCPSGDGEETNGNDEWH